MREEDDRRAEDQEEVRGASDETRELLVSISGTREMLATIAGGLGELLVSVSFAGGIR